MSLTWRILRKDLWRLRLPLALWIGVIAAKLVLGALMLWGHFDHFARFDHIAAAGSWLIALEVLTGYALVAAFIHDDVLVGTTAFWMTRPIAGGRLFTAKLIGLGMIFGVGPLAVTLPWWLACGYGARELALATGETLFWQAAVVVFALPLAALTDGFGRYLMWTLVVIVAIMAAGLMMLTTPGEGGAAHLARDLAETRGWLGLLLFLTGGCAAAVHQFRARRIGRSFAIVGAGVAAALVVLGVWPWNLLMRKSAPVERPDSPAAGITVAVGGAWTRTVPGKDTELTISLKVDGVPQGYRSAGAEVENRWTWPGGLTLAREGWLQEMDYYGTLWSALGLSRLEPVREPRNLAAIMRQRRGLPLLPADDQYFGDTYLTVPPSFAARMRQEPPSYKLRAHFWLLRRSVVGEGPLRTGEALQNGTEQTRIVRVAPTQSGNIAALGDRKGTIGRTVSLIERAPMLWWEADEGELNTIGTLLFFHWTDETYFLVNRARGEASRCGWRGAGAARFGTVGIFWRELEFFPPRELRAGTPAELEAWFDGVTLAKVVSRQEERFTRELRLERFTVEPVAPKGAVQ